MGGVIALSCGGSERSGWPLVINGALLFAINQGDRIAVGAVYSKEQLAVWSNALLLVSAPLMLLGRVAVSIALPILSRCKAHRSVFDDRYAAYMQGLAMIAALLATAMLLAGGPVMKLVFGPAYAQAGEFIGLLALGQAIRVIRIGPTVAALVYGQTTTLAAANLGRMVGVALAIAAASQGAEMKWIAIAGVLGEVLALGLAIGGSVLVRRSRRCRAFGSVYPRRCLCAVCGSWWRAVSCRCPQARWRHVQFWLRWVWLPACCLVSDGCGGSRGYLWDGSGGASGGANRNRAVRCHDRVEMEVVVSPRPAVIDAGVERGELRRCAMAGVLRVAARSRRLVGRCLGCAALLEGGHYYSASMRRILKEQFGVTIGAYSYGGCFVPGAFPAGTTIGRYVSIANGLRAFGRNHPTNRLSMHPFFYNRSLGLVKADNIESSSLNVGHDAWIGEGVIITPGCSRIGIGAVIGAGAVVTRDVPDFAVSVGNPARVIRLRFSESVCDVILASRWWERTIAECREVLDDMVRPLGPDAWVHPLLCAAAIPVADIRA
jgi:acetyltransferase-like isoleucine patch superfamily enzyme